MEGEGGDCSDVKGWRGVRRGVGLSYIP